jgi:hypothetical protein
MSWLCRTLDVSLALETVLLYFINRRIRLVDRPRVKRASYSAFLSINISVFLEIFLISDRRRPCLHSHMISRHFRLLLLLTLLILLRLGISDTLHVLVRWLSRGRIGDIVPRACFLDKLDLDAFSDVGRAV